MSRQQDALDRPLARRNAPSFTETFIEPLARLRGQVDRLFDEFPARWPSLRLDTMSGMLVPAVEMTETKKAFKLTVEVPGMEAADIEMHVHDGGIFISGEKKERREDEDEHRRLLVAPEEELLHPQLVHEQRHVESSPSTRSR